MNNNPDGNESAWWRRPRAWWTFGIPLGAVAAFFVGAAALGAFNWVIHKTSTNDFCFTCHSHQAFIRPEYEASSHFRNAAGVRADCADCHLPHDWWSLVYTKMVVSADIIPELMGKLDSAEKFEAHRAEMAEAVWAQFRANDSQFCRSCHDPAAMDPEQQKPMVARIHAKLKPGGKTCIDCHRGVAHELPQQAAAD